MCHMWYSIISKIDKDAPSLHGRNPVRAFLMQSKEVAAVPRKPKQPCAYPGCPRLSDGRYCEEHRKLVEKNYEQYSRDPAVHKKYGRAWKRIRDSYVQTHPFCEKCFEQGAYLTRWNARKK